MIDNLITGVAVILLFVVLGIFTFLVIAGSGLV